MMLRTGWEPQPASRSIRSRFVGELAVEDEQLRSVLVGNVPAIRSGALGPSIRSREPEDTSPAITAIVPAALDSFDSLDSDRACL